MLTIACSYLLYIHVFLVVILRSTPHHISLIHKCLDYCYVQLKHIYLTSCLHDVLLVNMRRRVVSNDGPVYSRMHGINYQHQ